MARLAACCFLFTAALGAQQSSGYAYSSRGIGSKQGNGGFDVFDVKSGDQIGVLKVGGDHIDFKLLAKSPPILSQP